MEQMKVLLRNPSRESTFSGPISGQRRCCASSTCNRETVLVIRGGTLVPGDAMLDDDDVVEIRPSSPAVQP